jgi:hypothetical protein
LSVGTFLLDAGRGPDSAAAITLGERGIRWTGRVCFEEAVVSAEIKSSAKLLFEEGALRRPDLTHEDDFAIISDVEHGSKLGNRDMGQLEFAHKALV